MKNVRTIRLELLRHGPARNQLISPLTQYIGTCGPHNLASITIDIEHWKLMELLSRLSYRRPGNHTHSQPESIGNEERHLVLDEMAAIVTPVLEANKGLATQLGTFPGEDTLLELRLVMSATELALLPFEISRMLEGMNSGSGHLWLGLQSRTPVCITRSSRSVQEILCNWRVTPRILFITAGVETPLVEAHLYALLSALDPWLPIMPPVKLDKSALLKKLHNHIEVITDASLDKITEACRKRSFTHVHILAHGVSDSNRMGLPVGLLLQGKNNAGEVVSAGQLSSALTSEERSCDRPFPPLPRVLTLASCHSSHAGDPVHSHGSMAHLLHAAGIPVVIGSQFPLSYSGSAHMVRTLYRMLLKGCDPRIALWKTRRNLHARCSEKWHDWASLVGYMALPENFSEQLVDFQYHQAKRALDVSMAGIDDCLAGKHCENSCSDSKKNNGLGRQLSSLLQRLDKTTTYLPLDPAYATEVLALKGAIAKRKAQVFFDRSVQETRDGEKVKLQRQSLELLSRALDYYRKAARECVRESTDRVQKKRALHWSLTQYLSLMAVLFGHFNEDAQGKWHAAMYSAKVDMEESVQGSENWIWASASAMELYLLRHAAWYSRGQDPSAEKKARELACKIHRYSSESRAVQLTCAQLERYSCWWSQLEEPCLPEEFCDKKSNEVRTRLKTLADVLIDVLNPIAPSCPGGRAEPVI